MLDNCDTPVLAEVWRGGYLEAQHRGALIVTAPDGSSRLSLGDVTSPMLPRSAVKPLQAVAMLRAGLDVAGAELALVGASHSGEPFHLEAVTAILDGAALSVSDLRNTPGLPYQGEVADHWLQAGHGRQSLVQNCSGKHAGMLRTCVRADWRTDTYLSPEHPLQRATRATVAELTGAPVGDPVVDGCGAPAFAVPLAGLARAFGALASADEGPEKAVADAFRAFPEYASGTTRDEAVFHREVPGLVCKLGAEGCFAVGLADGTGIAVKISDGGHRAIPAVLVAVLESLGLGTRILATLDPFPVLGHGEVVGRITPSAGLLGSLTSLAD